VQPGQRVIATNDEKVIGVETTTLPSPSAG